MRAGGGARGRASSRAAGLTRARVAATLVLLGASTTVAAPAHAGLTPAQLHTAYGLPRTSPVAQTVAVVVAYDAPTAAEDLDTFTARFQIPPCSATDGCFRKVNQRGDASPLPAADPTGGSFVAEAALGVQTARGICQNCRVLLVEADTDARGDLAAAVATAVRLGATEVATAYLQADEDVGRGAYDHPGVAITAAAGDSGFFEGANSPASLPGVVAVGGTRLSLAAGGRYAGETVWRDGPRETTTSGCTIYSRAPSWQTLEAASVGCAGNRSVADVAAVASPGAEIYTSTPASGLMGWIEAGGTSFASPLIAGVFALAGGLPAGASAPATLYANFRTRTDSLHDVTRGSNGSCPKTRGICTARAGYDGPTGVGTPRGVAGFRAVTGTRLDRRRPRVTVNAASRRLRSTTRGGVRLGLHNDNGFPVTASLRLRTSPKSRGGAPPQTLSAASGRFSIAPRSARSLPLRLSSAGLARIKRVRSAAVDVTVTLRAGGGRQATVVQRVVLRAPATLAR